MRPELEWQADPVQLLRGLANRVADTAACEGRARAEFNDLTRFYTAELWADYNIPAEAMDAALNAARSALDASQRARRPSDSIVRWRGSWPSQNRWRCASLDQAEYTRVATRMRSHSSSLPSPDATMPHTALYKLGFEGA